MKKYSEKLIDLNEKIWNYAELKFQENKSSQAMISLLEDEGFEIEKNVADIQTAYIGTYGSGYPVIGILAEYDALSGLSQVADLAVKKPLEGMENGHGCGHNLLGTAAIGAALKIRDYLKESKKSGSVKIIGCPGEEGGSGKTYMARAGVFDDLDLALTWHPFNTNAVITGSFLANSQVYFKFKGISSHAAASPHLGRSALDAVTLMNVGVNFLREHMEDGDRVHYAVTDTGGSSPNVVQGYSEVLYLIRSTSTEKVKNLYDRVVKIAKGAALMTETELEIDFDKACSEVVPNSVLEEVLYESFQKIGVPDYTEEELEYAKKFSETLSEKDIKSEIVLNYVPNPKELYEKLKSRPLANFIVPHNHSDKVIPGSTDVGDVSKLVPTAQIMTSCYTVGTPGHSWQSVAQGKSSIATKGMFLASNVLADAAISLIEDTGLIEEAKKEFEEATEGKKYISPIPPGVNPRI